MARRRMERAGVWLTSTNTMVAELVQDWTTPQGMPLVKALTAISPMLPVPGRGHDRRRADPRLSQRSAAVNGVRLHYWIGGDPEGQPVVLWHGFLSTGYAWRHVAPALADAGLAVLVPDMRGYGDSDKPPGVEGYDARALAEEAARLGRPDRFRPGRPRGPRGPRHGRTARAALGRRPSGRGEGAALHRSARHARRGAAPGVRLYARSHGAGLDVVVDPAACARRPGTADRRQRARIPRLVLRGRPRHQSRGVSARRGGRISAHLLRREGVLGSLGVYRAAFTSIAQTEPLLRSKIKTPVWAMGGEKGLGARVGQMVALVAEHVKTLRRADQRPLPARGGARAGGPRRSFTWRAANRSTEGDHPWPTHSITANGDTGPLPADDLSRSLTVSNPDDADLPHLSVVGDNYTVLVSGKQTEGRYCLIDMLVPDGSGPPPHRHDFEEMFTLLEGEVEFTFRGQTMNVPQGLDGEHPRQCAAPVPQHLGQDRAYALHVHARRPGGILRSGRRSRCKPPLRRRQLSKEEQAERGKKAAGTCA